MSDLITGVYVDPGTGVSTEKPIRVDVNGQLLGAAGGGGGGASDTELAAAAALADDLANPTTASVGALASGWDGSNWQRFRAGYLAVQSTTAVIKGFLNTIPTLRYNATAPTLADGNVAPFQADSKGNLKTAESRLMPAGNLSTFLKSSAGSNLKATPGAVHAAFANNFGTAVLYLMLFDRITAPSAGLAPSVMPIPIPAAVGTQPGYALIGQDLLGGGVDLGTGVSWGISTTPDTYTAAPITSVHAMIRWS